MDPSTRQQNQGRHVWSLAKRQHGVISRAQLLELGVSADAITHRLKSKRLHRVMRGVYAVGRPAGTQEERWMAAVLACGEGAVLSHSSAAALMGIGVERSHIEVSVPGTSHLSRSGLTIHRRSVLRPDDRGQCMRVPVTSPALTLIDISLRGSMADLERAVNVADMRDLISPDELRAELDRHAAHSGVVRIRQILDRHTFRLTDSELERRFLELALAAGLGTPLTQQQLNGFRVDFYWPDLGIVVETDGLRYHRTPAQQARDRVRDQTHTAAGLRPLRFTHAQVCFEPTQVEATLRATAARGRGMSGES